MDVVAAAAASASASTFPRRPRTASTTDDWKTIQCVTAPKMLSLSSAPRAPRAPADTSGFVLIKFQVLSVPPEERPPQVEAAAAARTLHAMGSAAAPSPPQPSVIPPAAAAAAAAAREAVSAPHTQPHRPNGPPVQPRIAPPQRSVQRRNAIGKVDAPAAPASPGAASSSIVSGGQGQRDHPCTFPGCTKSFERRYNLRVHMRRHTGETPYPCKHPGCNQMFKWRSSLAHHMKTKHKIDSNIAAQIQKNRGLVSPGAITDMRPTEDGSMTGRTIPFAAVDSPAGSSSGGSSKKGSNEGMIPQPMLPPAAQLPHPTSRLQVRRHPVPRETPVPDLTQPIRAHSASPRPMIRAPLRPDMRHQTTEQSGARQMHVSQ